MHGHFVGLSVCGWFDPNRPIGELPNIPERVSKLLLPVDPDSVSIKSAACLDGRGLE